jgi:hypothetical protein
VNVESSGVDFNIELGWACSICVGGKKCWLENFKARDHLDDLGINEKID